MNLELYSIAIYLMNINIIDKLLIKVINIIPKFKTMFLK